MAHHPVLDEQCQMCRPARRLARHKVAEVIETDWPGFARRLLDGKIGEADVSVSVVRHELTNFLCCEHFAVVMGPLAARLCEASVVLEREG